MQLTPEIKQQLAAQKAQCIFCKLISQEIPGKIVFEDDKTIALLDIYPAVKGHTLFMLKEHYPLPVYISREEFIHKFGLLPGLSKAIKSAMVKTGMNVFMAMGGAAGQQSYHFMIHLLPRENEDKFFNFLLKKGVEITSEEEAVLSAAVEKVLGRSVSSGTKPAFLISITENSTIIYENEKVLCVIPDQSSAKGHLVIYSKAEEKYIERLSQEDSAHLFFTASTAAAMIFEHFKAQGTNILLMSGESDDNLNGRLALHILPRWQNDALQGLVWEPKRPGYNLDEIASKIKDKAWNVKFEGNIKKRINTLKSSPALPDAQEEIVKAIDMFRGK